MSDSVILPSEDAVSFSFQKAFGTESRLFFKFHHNLNLRHDRTWHYYCAPEVDGRPIASGTPASNFSG
jgi:hypothetical protein